MGFKYLDYFLKTNNYRKEYWIWILKKGEKRIGNWVFKWLSIGWRLIFVKSILKSILVYWISHANIHHPFFSCPFSSRIYFHYEKKFNYSFPISSSVHSFLGHWFSRTVSSAPYRYLPLFIFWGIWLLRNLCIFENKKPAFSSLIARIDGLVNTYPVL